MEHIKKYWWAYLILIVAIYFGWKWYMKNLVVGTSNRVEGSPCVITTSEGEGVVYGIVAVQDVNGFWKNGVCVPTTKFPNIGDILQT